MAPKRGLIGSGTIVKIGEKKLNFVQSVTGLGGATSGPDITCLDDKMKKTGTGLQDLGTPSITYFFDNSDTQSDFRILKGYMDTGNPVAVEVTLPPSDGTKFASTAIITTYIDGDITPDGLVMAKADLALQADWAITNGGT